ncbi:MAG: NADH-quinone oxidoreductase subunit C [Chloroflexi bacterium]|nr:NADH-quinone oxidoreductase subunit C [Chloroflexota bacterium]
MNEFLHNTASALQQRFGAQPSEFRGDLSLEVSPQRLVETCLALRDEFGFEMLNAQSAVDYWPQQEPRFHVLYFLFSVQHNVRLGLRVPVNGDALNIPTIEGVYPNANWHEREIWDMFGVRFEGHTDMRRIIMPYDWQGHPLRKDYPLGYEEVQFTFNYEDIDARKPYAKE